jgi:hypothetical protein
MSPMRLTQLRDMFGNVFVKIYAVAEAVSPGLVLPKNKHGTATEAECLRLASAGYPPPSVELRIVKANGKDTQGKIIDR